MKKLVKLICTFLFLLLITINISAQKKGKIQLIGGVSFSSEYLYKDIVQNKVSNNVGLFTQIQLGKRFSTVTSLNYGQRRYEGSTDYDYGWCGVGLTESFVHFTNYGFKEKSLTLEQLIKLHINHRRVSYFIGAGGLLKLPQQAQSPPSDEILGLRESFIAPDESDYLDRRIGILYALGIDYRCWGKYSFLRSIKFKHLPI